MIRDTRRTPPPDKYGAPGRQYPTPNIYDAVLVVDADANTDNAIALLPGTPHPDDATRLLVWTGPIKGNANEKAIRRIYCTTRAGQDAYNAVITYADGSRLYPTYTRTYFLPRAGYAPATEGAALTALVGLTLVSGGTGYANNKTALLDLVFTGGGGTGAKGKVQVVKGVVVAVLLEDGGDAFTSVPTVSIPGTGSGASITASIQATTCLLTRQRADPQEGEFGSLFLRVERRYETLPGPILSKPSIDPADGSNVIEYTQRVLVSTAVKTKGLEYTSGYYVQYSTVIPDPEEGSVVGTLVWHTKQVKGTVDIVSTTGFSANFPEVYESVPDTVTGLIPVIVKRVVAAGTIGSVIAHNAKDISLITLGTPGGIRTDIAHFFTTGDVVVIAGVVGGSTINGTRTITVVDRLNFTLDGVTISSAGTGGTVYRTKDTDAYVEVQPTDQEWGSISLRSFIKTESVLGTAGGASYPVTVSFALPDTVTGGTIFLSGDGNDAGVNWTVTSGIHGEWKGMATEYYFRPDQLASWITSYPIPVRFQPSNQLGRTLTSGNKIWTFKIPTSGILLASGATTGPNGGKVLHVSGDQIKLGIFRVTLVEIFLP